MKRHEFATKFGMHNFINVIKDGLRDLSNPGITQIPGLDALRTFAILLVFWGHVYGAYAAQTGLNFGLTNFPLFYFGWTGVDLFFVLSGYLIGRQLWGEAFNTGTVDVPRFLLRRGFRIWPYYYFIVAVSIISGSSALPAYWPDVTFLSNYFHHQVSGGWSLATEEQFYILVPLLVLAIGKFTQPRRAIWVVCAILLCLPLLRWFSLSGHSPDERTALIYSPIHTHSDGLLVGVVLSWLSIFHPNYMKKRGFLQNVRPAIILVATGIFLRALNRDLFGFTALGLVFGACALFLLRDNSAISRLLRPRIFYWLSKLSFGIYLNHFMIIEWIMDPLLRTGLFNSRLGFIFVSTTTMSISMSFAFVTFLLIEHPFLAIRKAWLSSRTKMRLAL